MNLLKLPLFGKVFKHFQYAGIISDNNHLWWKPTLHKKRSFPLRISSVNVTKFVGNCGFGHIFTEEILNVKFHFLCSETMSVSWTLSSIILKNGQTYFKNFAAFTPQDFWSMLGRFSIFCRRKLKYVINRCNSFIFIWKKDFPR